MPTIAQNIADLAARLPQGVRLIAVSKFHPAERLREAYDAGHRLFGENRVQELVAKAPQLPDDVEWHFIGHLQRNKVRQLLPHVAMIHSVHSVELLRLIDKEAARIGRAIDVLIELHVAQEMTKSGFAPDEALSEITPELVSSLANVRLRGVMTMATFTDDMEQVEREFTLAQATFEQLKDGLQLPSFDQLSMGMSDDWPVAVRHGSTMVRIGTDIFGPREY
ncbi:MAG: YggS family pyridoxal phosphate-dependent enzyme [Muribaculaceae bacterium]|nr:YggS family pyridoxal phosphate-dependent enzyme [Muribaculaceae bacterium]